MRLALACWIVVACRPATPQTPAPATTTITLSPGLPTPVLDGPFMITTINPGSDLHLAIAPARRCEDEALVWFEYSGGGASVGAGQTLCARSRAESPRAHGFSGHR